jgi:hypothetical protein
VNPGFRISSCDGFRNDGIGRNSHSFIAAKSRSHSKKGDVLVFLRFFLDIEKGGKGEKGIRGQRAASSGQKVFEVLDCCKLSPACCLLSSDLRPPTSYPMPYALCSIIGSVGGFQGFGFWFNFQVDFSKGVKIYYCKIVMR